MPSPISNTAAITALVSQIRLALASKAGSRAGGKVQGAQRRDPARGTHKAHRPTSHQPATALPALITARIEALDPDAADFRSQLLHLVVETALLQEFGNQLINAPGFQGMVDQVAFEMNAAPELQGDVDALVRGLRSA